MTEVNETYGCILSKFYIKPQLRRVDFRGVRSCILSKFYIKPQRKVIHGQRRQGCILSKFYIKPQHIGVECCHLFVVSYRNSTSNHNCVGWIFGVSVVVSYRNSTSNHNGKSFMDREDKVVSYRNSTSNHNTSVSNAAISSLYLIEILHQTTTNQWRRCNTGSCILSKFYIKPQPWSGQN